MAVALTALLNQSSAAQSDFLDRVLAQLLQEDSDHLVQLNAELSGIFSAGSFAFDDELLALADSFARIAADVPSFHHELRHLPGIAAPVSDAEPISSSSAVSSPGVDVAPAIVDAAISKTILDSLDTSHLALASVSASCEPFTLPLPDSLPEAAAQIESLAAASVSGFDAVLSSRARRDLQRYHGRVLSALQGSPYGGDMSRRQERELGRFFRALASTDRRGQTCDARRWVQLLSSDWLRRVTELIDDDARVDGGLVHSTTTATGRIVFGGRGDDNYQLDDALFILDVGGNDIYGMESPSLFNGSPQIVVDLAGNDRYESGRPGGVAAGIGRTAILIDIQGDDEYDAPSLSQASAIGGIGILVDSAGDDRYRAGSMSQGFALYGIALLLDAQGNDNYALAALGQGLGMTQGHASLLDLDGDDEYRAKGMIPTNYGTPGLTDAWAQGVGLGVRDHYPGGVGILQDFAGDDVYDAASFAQGGGYYFGVGALIDGATARTATLAAATTSPGGLTPAWATSPSAGVTTTIGLGRSWRQAWHGTCLWPCSKTWPATTSTTSATSAWAPAPSGPSPTLSTWPVRTPIAVRDQPAPIRAHPIFPSSSTLARKATTRISMIRRCLALSGTVSATSCQSPQQITSMSPPVSLPPLARRSAMLWFLAAMVFWLLNVALHLEFSNWIGASYASPFGSLRPVDYTIPIAVLTASLWLARLLVLARRSPRPALAALAWGLWLLVAFASMSNITTTPVEMIHFLQYAILAYLLARCLDPGHARWPLATLLALTFWLGVVDEVNQYMLLTPSNSSYLDFNDFLLNLIGAQAGLLAYYGFHERMPTGAEGSRFWQILAGGLYGLSALLLVIAAALGRLVYAPQTAIPPGGIGVEDGVSRLYLQREPGLLSSWQPSFAGEPYYVCGWWEFLIAAVLLTALTIGFGMQARRSD